jgi:hypothetical protein
MMLGAAAMPSMNYCDMASPSPPAPRRHHPDLGRRGGLLKSASTMSSASIDVADSSDTKVPDTKANDSIGDFVNLADSAKAAQEKHSSWRQAPFR